jgi:ATP-dependent Clp protease protease subunit
MPRPAARSPRSAAADSGAPPDPAAIRAEAIAHARAVVDLCRLAGQPQMAGRFLEQDASLDEVRAALLAAKAEPSPRSRPITRSPAAARPPAPGARSSPAPSS